MSLEPDLPEHVARNRAAWDELAAECVESGERHWGEDEFSWGIWGVPEAQLRLLPEDLTGEYGAAIWCDPYRWIPEAARLLRPGGELLFLGNHAPYVSGEWARKWPAEEAWRARKDR
jgi:hypothetical protein